MTNGVGWAQVDGQQIVEIHAGDFSWCPPGQRHWEGATPEEEMTYVAIQEEGDDGGVQFLARVRTKRRSVTGCSRACRCSCSPRPGSHSSHPWLAAAKANRCRLAVQVDHAGPATTELALSGVTGACPSDPPGSYR